MFKMIFRFLLVTMIAAALGFGIYHLIQPGSVASLRSGLGEFGSPSRGLGGRAVCTAEA
ncbi:MAG TPA: hypothetical protein VLZ89_04970 [Anaerolineales bacterium]|nr:hypothetical protein [Anaerolineales bacterium]